MTLQSSGQIAFSDINVELGQSAATAATLGQLEYRLLANVTSGVISMSNFYGKTWKFTKGIIAYGRTLSTSGIAISNLVSNIGVIASDTSAVGTARQGPAGASYGGDKALFGYGYFRVDNYDYTYYDIFNLVSNTGVVASDSGGANDGSGRYGLAAASYGGDKAIFGYGYRRDDNMNDYVNYINLISNAGAVVSFTSGVGSARMYLAAAGYGGDRAIFGFGDTGGFSNITNLVSNTGVVAADVSGIGTARQEVAAATYGVYKAIFGYGTYYDGNGNAVTSITNLVSDVGVVASDTSGVGTARYGAAAVTYGGDRGIFAYGASGFNTPVHEIKSNLVSNTGVVATDVNCAGSGRLHCAGSSYA